MGSDGISRGVAGGKVIILGEHAVVHGTSSMAMTLPGRMTVTVTPASGPSTLDVPFWGMKATVGGPEQFDMALTSIFEKIGDGHSGLALEAQTSLPPQAGLGSSAAVAAAAARAIFAHLTTKPDPDDVFDVVQTSEKVFHGNPSGLDARVVLGSGLVRYSRKGGVRRLEAPPPPLMIINTGEAGDTGMTVARFAARLDQNPSDGRHRLDQIANLVEEGIDAVKVWDLPTLGVLMNENQEHLRWFGVSTRSIDKACEIALACGALGAKLTGGGGGGCVVALVTLEFQDMVSATVSRAGFSVVPC